jgi:hypothetical protein
MELFHLGTPKKYSNLYHIILEIKNQENETGGARVTRRVELGNAHKNFVEKPEGKRQRVHTCRHKTNTSQKGWEGVDWIHLIQYHSGAGGVGWGELL